ncbi:hypothetical protein I7I53_02466 [Histoplasma capsulatum var. duboisii H88]|nr:hypothetical protein I7I53_02466 [Histoplasma capsulatum var. duboisii H88]
MSKSASVDEDDTVSYLIRFDYVQPLCEENYCSDTNSEQDTLQLGSFSLGKSLLQCRYCVMRLHRSGIFFLVVMSCDFEPHEAALML